MAEQFEASATGAGLINVNLLQRDAEQLRFAELVTPVQQTPGRQAPPIIPNPSTGGNITEIPGQKPRTGADDQEPTQRPGEDPDMFQMRQGLWQQRQFQNPTAEELEADRARRAKQQAQDIPAGPTGVQQAEQAFAEFQKAPDKQAALQHLGSKFIAGIQQADIDAGLAAGSASRALQLMGPERDATTMSELQAQALVMESLKLVPNEDRPFVADRMNALNNAITERGKENILHEIGQRFPYLAEALKRQAKATQDAAPVHAREKQLLDGVEHAVEDQLSARKYYADALEATGDKTTADALRAEGTDKYVAMFTAEARAKAEAMEEAIRRMTPPPQPVHPRQFDINWKL